MWLQSTLSSWSFYKDSNKNELLIKKYMQNELFVGIMKRHFV